MSSDLGNERPPIEGRFLHALGHRVFPYFRSITGDGVRQTLADFSRYLPGLRIHEIPSGTRVLDWTIPNEWNVHDAYIQDSGGNKVVDVAESNIHLVSYSQPVDTSLPLIALQAHLHSDQEHRDAIPYVTSYYHDTWGFCLTQTQRDSLKDETYRVFIDAELKPGSLTYADLVVPGSSPSEVLITTYVCHPSLANNELSGPLVSLALARWLMQLPSRTYTYRFVFAPETIGAITYIAKHLEHLRTHVVAGINLTCIGDNGPYSYLSSRLGSSAIDRIASRVCSLRPNSVHYSYLDRGSDERQYGMPGVGIPMISLMRTRYGRYPEYHTHLDNLEVVTPEGLQGGLDLVRDCIHELESSVYYECTEIGEPQLGRRGLYHQMHARSVAASVLLRTHILAYSDGQHSLVDIAEMCGVSLDEVTLLAEELRSHGLLRRSVLTKKSDSSI